MARGYLTTPISENIEETPEGFLIARDCVIGRTGAQTYSVRDLPQEAARDMGVDITNPAAQIDLFRAPEDVFHRDTLRSGEGKAVTDGHPPQFITPENFNKYSRGHIQNVHRGADSLDSGDMPMRADILIMAEPLLSRVRDKQVRELSLGYDYSIEKRGPRIYQTEIVINHLAVVPKGRAGHEARIEDAAPLLGTAPLESAAVPPGSGNGHAALIINRKPNKEKTRVKTNLLHLLGLGLKAKAADADLDPEELAQAALDIGRQADDRLTRDRRSRDEEFEVEETGQVRDRHSRDRHMDDRRSRDARRSRDLDPEIEVTHTEDARSRMHDRLDDMIDARDRRANDTDLEELKDLLIQFFDEEEEEPEHEEVEDDNENVIVEPDSEELEEVLADDTEAEPGEEVGPADEENLEDDEEEEEDSEEEEDEDEDTVCAHCGEAMDGEACPACGCRDKAVAKDSRRRAKDRATAHDGVAATLRMLRPVIARTNDRAVKAAFNAASSTLSRRSVARDASADYGGFASGARNRSRLPHNPHNTAQAADEANAKAQAAYDKQRKAGK